MRQDDWIVEARDLWYTYEGNDKASLRGLTLNIRRGAKVAMMGGNGSGKSTFFLCLNGILRPQKGQVILDGKPISYHRKGLLEARRKVGIVFQEPDNQLFSASVYQEISFGILNLGVEEEKAREEVEKVIEELGIGQFRHRPTHALSGGQKKQVAIADILVMEPELMILDEPVSALDPLHTKRVEELIEGLTGRGITVVMATHDMDYAYQWADEIVILKDGQVFCQGTPYEVCSDRESLAATNLEQPKVLQIYDRLTEGETMKRQEVPPRNVEELITRLMGKDE